MTKNREYENMKDVVTKAIIFTAIVVMIIVADTIGWYYLTEVKGYCDYIGEWAASILLVVCFNIWLVIMLFDFIKRQMRLKIKKGKIEKSLSNINKLSFSDIKREERVNIEDLETKIKDKCWDDEKSSQCLFFNYRIDTLIITRLLCLFFGGKTNENFISS